MQNGYTLSEWSESKGFAPIFIVFILTIITVLGGVLVYTNYKSPVFDRTNNRTKSTPIPQTTQSPQPAFIPSPAASASSALETTDTSNWKVYRNDKYGFQYSYPEEFDNNLMPIGPAFFADTSKFSSILSDGAYEHTLTYDKSTNKWIVTPGFNANAADAFCPYMSLTPLQQVPYYQIGDFRSGRPHYYAYVTKKAIIVLIDDFGFSIIDSLRFDHPEDVRKASCVIANTK